MISLSAVVKGGTGEVFLDLYPLADRPLRDEAPLIRCVFHVPGDLGDPDFSGIQIHRYYKKYGYILIEIAVPREYVLGDNAYNRNADFLLQCKSFIMDSVWESVRLAAEYFRKKGMPFDESAAQESVDVMDREMTMDKMKEAVAPPRVRPPSPDLLRRVKKASDKKKAK